MSLIDLADAKLALGIDSDDDSADALLDGYVAGITRVIERETGEVIDERAETEVLRLNGHDQFVLRHKPIVELTSLVTLDGSYTWDLTTLEVDAVTGIVTAVGTGGAPYGRFRATYSVGYEVPPENYRQAALLTLQYLWEPHRGVGTDVGGVVDPQEVLSEGFVLPPKARAWLGRLATADRA